MIKIIQLYGLTTLVFFAIDMVWLGLIANKFYFKNLGDLMRSPINWAPAILFYLLYIIGILYLAVYPGGEKDSWKLVATHAAVFGFLAYATYDLTNLATVKGWPLNVTLVDLVWGTAITTVVALISFNIYKWLY